MGRRPGWIVPGTGVLVGAVVALVLVLGVVLGVVPDVRSAPNGLAASPTSTSTMSETGGHHCHGPLEQNTDHVSAAVPTRPTAPSMAVPERLPDGAVSNVVAGAPLRCGGASRAAPSLAALQVLRI